MISARLNYADQELRGGQPTKVIAYMLDNLTISILDLRYNQIQATINHDSKIDYLELNPAGTKLLFRDKRRQLYLYNIKEQKKQTLLNYCKFVSWVQNSDVVVAQNRSNLCVWYSIEEPDKVTMYQIKGDVDSIQRTEGKTEVIVDDGMSSISYNLDEALIEFGAALEYKGLEQAVEILEPLNLSPETEANWKTLAKLALEQ
jgi:intraflagellar transport protein 172